MRASLFAFILLLLLAGCGKQPARAVSASGPAANNVPPALGLPARQAAPPPAGASTWSQKELAGTLRELTQAVRKYAADNQTRPKSLQELVAHGYLTHIPPAPPGKKFAINNMLQVCLADQ
jgi:hypothetical protein